MATQLTEQQQIFLQELTQTKDAAEFRALYQNAQAEMKTVLAENEVQGPSQYVGVTLAELSRLYILLCENLSTDPKRASLRDSIRMLSTAQQYFREDLQRGSYRPLTIKASLSESLEFRNKLRLIGLALFSHKPEVAATFADKNSSRTLEEERKDLQNLVALLKTNEEAFKASKYFSASLIDEGKALLNKVEGRELLSLMGLENGKQAIQLRNSLLTYAVIVAKSCAAIGALEFFQDAEKRAAFEKIKLSSALRAAYTPKKPKEEPAKEQNPA